MTLVNSVSISSIFSGWISPPTVLSAIISTFQVRKRVVPTEPPTFDIIAGKVRDYLQHFKHSRDGLLQDFGFFAHDVIFNLVRKLQNSLQPIEDAGGHLVVFVLFLQKLIGQALLLS
jgi:hypothetical protein